MVVQSEALYRAAGVSGIIALIALVVSAVALALFFGGAGQIYGPINDVFVAITMLALLLPILAVDGVAGPQTGLWLRVVTVAALTGAVLAAVGQVLLVAGVIDLETSFITGALGIVPVLIWIVALIVVSLPLGILPASIGWLAAAAMALILVGSLLSSVTNGPIAGLAWTAVVAMLALWLGNLSTALLQRGAA